MQNHKLRITTVSDQYSYVPVNHYIQAIFYICGPSNFSCEHRQFSWLKPKFFKPLLQPCTNLFSADPLSVFKQILALWAMFYTAVSFRLHFLKNKNVRRNELAEVNLRLVVE
jgi:hypothetical protein